MTPLQLFRKENLELVQKENPLLTKAQIRHKLMDKYKQLDKQVRQDYKKRAADISANESMAIKRAEELETGFKTMNGKDKQKAVTVVKTTKIPDTPILLVPDAVIQSTDKDTQTISVTLPAFEKASVENLNQIYWDCLRELQVENTHDSINIDEFVLTPPIGYGISNISDSIPDTVADSISIKKKRPFRPWEQEYDEYKLPKIKGNPDSEMLKLMRCINDGVQYIKTKIELKTQDLARSKAVSYTIGEVHVPDVFDGQNVDSISCVQSQNSTQDVFTNSQIYGGAGLNLLKNIPQIDTKLLNAKSFVALTDKDCDELLEDAFKVINESNSDRSQPASNQICNLSEHRCEGFEATNPPIEAEISNVRQVTAQGVIHITDQGGTLQDKATNSEYTEDRNQDVIGDEEVGFQVPELDLQHNLPKGSADSTVPDPVGEFARGKILCRDESLSFNELPNADMDHSESRQEPIPRQAAEFTAPMPSPDQTPLHRASSYDTIAKVQSFKRTPSSVYEKFLDDTLFLD